MAVLTVAETPRPPVLIVAAPYAPAGPVIAGTSATPNDVSLGGEHTFAMEQTGLGFVPGVRVRASATDDPTMWMEGIITAFDGTNLIVDVDASNGAGIFDSWAINVAGEPGKKGDKGDTGAQGPQGPQGIMSSDSPVFTGNPTAPTPLPDNNSNSLATTQFIKSLLVNYQVFDPDLTALSGVTATNAIIYRSAPDTWAPVTIGTGLTFSGGTLSAGGMAPLDSPVFTGNPTAPTPTAGDADTTIATTGFVAASFAPLASPILTGNPQAPTPAPGDNDTSIATTAYVQDALTNGYQPLDADLTALAGLTGTNVFFYRTGDGAWSPVIVGANLLFSGGTLSGTGTGGGGGVPSDSPVFTGDPQAPTPPPGDADGSIATTQFVATALATKANVASPSFSGNPQAPTPAPGDNDTSIATTAFVQNAISGKADTSALTAKADLASPTFTGDPKAPTPAAADNDTSISTTAYVTRAIDNYHIANILTTFAPIASPTFTGDPKAPTPATSDNDTSIATTAFVQAAITAAIAAVGGTPWSTGDVKLTLKTTADAGWILMNDQTIGDASSGAAYANANAQNLYVLLWNTILDAWCPVTGGRGANAAADWAAHKPMKLPRTLGRVLAAYGSGAGLTARALGQFLGEETHTSILGELAPHTHPVNTPSYHIPIQDTGQAYNTADIGSVFNAVRWAGAIPAGANSWTATSVGDGTSFNVMQPTAFLNIMIKL
jgi:microcystin-dependent protein